MKWNGLLPFLAAAGAALAEHKSFANDRSAERAAMVRTQIEARGVQDSRVLQAMAEVPRHEFLPAEYQASAYADHPLPIGHGQTISQPYIVAFMTQALALKPDSKVLEVGTGSGYQAAILGKLAAEVHSMEIVEPLAREARETLNRLGIKNVHVHQGDGYAGWPEAAPYDGIIVTCAPDRIPPALMAQLKEGGRMVIPVGAEGGVQELVVVEKTGGKVRRSVVMDVRFVPMTREAQRN